MKNIQFYTIAMLFNKLPTPKVYRCLQMDIRYSTFDIGSHVISCLREYRKSRDKLSPRMGLKIKKSIVNVQQPTCWGTVDNSKIKSSCTTVVRCSSIIPNNNNLFWRFKIPNSSYVTLPSVLFSPLPVWSAYYPSSYAFHHVHPWNNSTVGWNTRHGRSFHRIHNRWPLNCE